MVPRGLRLRRRQVVLQQRVLLQPRHVRHVRLALRPCLQHQHRWLSLRQQVTLQEQALHQRQEVVQPV